jgi:hypothetical protein
MKIATAFLCFWRDYPVEGCRRRYGAKRGGEFFVNCEPWRLFYFGFGGIMAEK